MPAHQLWISAPVNARGPSINDGSWCVYIVEGGSALRVTLVRRPGCVFRSRAARYATKSHHLGPNWSSRNNADGENMVWSSRNRRLATASGLRVQVCRVRGPQALRATPPSITASLAIVHRSPSIVRRHSHGWSHDILQPVYKEDEEPRMHELRALLMKTSSAYRYMNRRRAISSHSSQLAPTIDGPSSQCHHS